MWYLISQENPDHKCVILGGKVFVVGRKDCDVLVAGDATVSRRHAELSMSHTDANLTNTSRLPILLLKDLSKFGTWVNLQRVQGEHILKDGDSIQFGSPKSVYMVVYEPLVMTSSCLDAAAKKTARKQLCILGGHMINEWKADCSLLIMSKISVTIKVICALVSLKPIVTADYLEAYIKHLQGTVEKPDPNVYLPSVAETQLDPNEVSFMPDDRRQKIFQGLTFVFLSQKQFKKMSLAIELGGGTPIMLEEGSEDKMLVERNVLVMNCTDTDLTQSAEKWVTRVQSMLEKNGKHMIQDAELGYAVLYCSRDKHCNPDYIPDIDIDLSLPSQSLSQADRFVPDTETQNRSQPGGSTQTRRDRQNTQTTVSDTILPRSGKSQTNKTSTSPDPDTKQGSSATSSSKTPRLDESQRDKPAVVQVKEERISQTSSQQGSSKRGRLEADTDFATNSSRSKRVKTEPSTPTSKSRTSEVSGTKSSNARDGRGAAEEPETVWDSDDDIDYSKIEMESSPSQSVRKSSPSPKSSRSTRKMVRKASPEPESAIPVRKSSRNVSPVPEATTSARKSNRNTSPDPGSSTSARRSGRHTSPTPPPSPIPSTRKSEQTDNTVTKRLRSRSPEVQGKTQIKTETQTEMSSSDIASGTVLKSNGQGKGQHAATGNVEIIYQRSSKTEVIDEKYEQSEMPVEDDDVDDDKSAVQSRSLPAGFLTTRKPIQDQVKKSGDYEPEADLPTGCITVQVISLVCRRPLVKDKGAGECPEGFSRWKGKVVRNFKKFKKSQHAGSQGLPIIIGGSDLEVHQGQRSKEMDDWLRESVQADSQHTSDDRRAQELFNFNPNAKRKGR